MYRREKKGSVLDNPRRKLSRKSPSSAGVFSFPTKDDDTIWFLIIFAHSLAFFWWIVKMRIREKERREGEREGGREGRRAASRYRRGDVIERMGDCFETYRDCVACLLEFE